MLRANADDAGSDDVFPCLKGRMDLVLRGVEHAVCLALHRVQGVSGLLADVARPGIRVPPQVVSHSHTAIPPAIAPTTSSAPEISWLVSSDRAGPCSGSRHER